MHDAWTRILWDVQVTHETQRQCMCENTKPEDEHLLDSSPAERTASSSLDGYSAFWQSAHEPGLLFRAAALCVIWMLHDQCEKHTLHCCVCVCVCLSHAFCVFGSLWDHCEPPHFFRTHEATKRGGATLSWKAPSTQTRCSVESTGHPGIPGGAPSMWGRLSPCQAARRAKRPLHGQLACACRVCCASNRRRPSKREADLAASGGNRLPASRWACKPACQPSI